MEARAPESGTGGPGLSAVTFAPSCAQGPFTGLLPALPRDQAGLFCPPNFPH